MKSVWAAFAILFCCSPCEAALSPRQLSAAILNPVPGVSLPLEAKFVNSAGAALTLGEAIGDKAAALILVDYTCRFICGTTLAIAAYGLSGTGLQPGKDFSFVVMGIDPNDKPADAKAMKDAELAPYPGLQASAHFLNGDASAISSVTKALNYTPVYDAELDQYAHPVGAVILTPDGRVSRLISGLNLNPQSFKAALSSAQGGTLSGLVEGIRLLCYGHSPLHGAYASVIRTVLAAGGLVTLVAIAGVAVLFARKGGLQS
jgi:protein SCO1/2